MNRDELTVRMRDFAVRVIRLVAALPKGRASNVIGNQLLKSATSIGANYRESGLASSRRHFITIMEIAQREADETIYWLDLLAHSGLVKPHLLNDLLAEAQAIYAIITSSILTAKGQP